MTKELVRKSYDRIAEAYHQNRINKTARNVRFLDRLRPYLPQSGTVLDLGCGGGCPISKYFADAGYDVLGVDISEKMIELAKNSVPNARFKVGDFERSNFPERSFDLIISFFAIIHLPRDTHAQLFKKMYKWLKEDGAIFVTLGALDNEEEQVDDWKSVPMYWSHFDSKTNLELIEQTGFEVIWHEEEEIPGDTTHLFIIAKRTPALAAEQ
jgi:SAM-dependent methyltransferase